MLSAWTEGQIVAPSPLSADGHALASKKKLEQPRRLSTSSPLTCFFAFTIFVFSPCNVDGPRLCSAIRHQISSYLSCSKDTALAISPPPTSRLPFSMGSPSSTSYHAVLLPVNQNSSCTPLPLRLPLHSALSFHSYAAGEYRLYSPLPISLCPTRYFFPP